jgi:N-acetylglutamate synthase-like GNAT family acetyltransferase
LGIWSAIGTRSTAPTRTSASNPATVIRTAALRDICTSHAGVGRSLWTFGRQRYGGADRVPAARAILTELGILWFVSSISAVTVRRARDADAHAIATLYQCLVSDGQINVLPERVRALGNHPDTYLLVAEIGGAVRATALVNLCADAMYGHQPYALIENVVVAEECRRQGIGRALFSYIEMLCREHDCSKMMLLSANHRVDSHRFFERCGFMQRKRGFVKYRREFVR